MVYTIIVFMKLYFLLFLSLFIINGCIFSKADPKEEALKIEKAASSLDLSSQKLEKFPKYILDMRSLENLDLSNNELSETLPAEIKNLSNLKILNLANNQMTNLPAELGQLKYLEELNLSNNNFTGLPHELGNLKNLKTLNLRGNNYSQADLDIISAKLENTAIIK